jgi:hypothetical protein
MGTRDRAVKVTKQVNLQADDQGDVGNRIMT